MKPHPCEQAFEPLINARDAAKLLGVHAATVLRMARAGKIPCVKVGKLWRFSVSELDAWVAAGTSVIRG
jgi:excisionase family DNA binding protein